VSVANPPLGAEDPSYILNQNVDAAQAIQNIADDLLRAFGRADVRSHEQVRLREVRGADPAVVTNDAPSF
jgi:hypothetical protein